MCLPNISSKHWAMLMAIKEIVLAILTLIWMFSIYPENLSGLESSQVIIHSVGYIIMALVLLGGMLTEKLLLVKIWIFWEVINLLLSIILILSIFVLPGVYGTLLSGIVTEIYVLLSAVWFLPNTFFMLVVYNYYEKFIKQQEYGSPPSDKIKPATDIPYQRETHLSHSIPDVRPVRVEMSSFV